MPILSIFLDGKDEPEELHKVVKLDKKEGWYTLAEGLEEGYHTITVRKRNRSYYGILAGVAAGVSKIKVTDGKLAEPPAAKELKIEVIGDSISCGDGIYANKQDFGGTQGDGWSTYAAYAARKLNADLNTIAISGNGLISSLFGDSLLDLPDQYPYVDRQIYSEDRKAVEWDFSKYVADVVIINLGTNDRAGVGEGKKFSEQDFEDAYVEFIDYIKDKYPDVKIIATLGAMGSELQHLIENAVERANEAHGEEFVYTSWLVPDPSDGKSGDNAHPSLKAHQRYGEQMYEKIKEILDK